MARASGDCGTASVFSVVAVCVVLWAAAAGARSPSARAHRHLKRLNKPAVRSIESPDGDIIDCVRISHQPAFDHPLLRNHTIQFRPAYHPEEGLYDEAKNSIGDKPMLQLWHQKGRCPEGTVPIRRTKKDDLLRASSMQRYGRKWHTAPNPMSVDPNMLDDQGRHQHQHAIVYAQEDKYHGAKATINVWKPKIQEKADEFSLAQLWIIGGAFNGDANTIEAGWQVSPDLYGDNNTRLFIYWTRDGYNSTGCYNILCSGFVQINSQIAMGATISPISNYGGSQYDISILIWKDPKKGDWWMQFGKYILGYWPSILFTYLADSASLIEWGGEVVNSEPDGAHTSTQMGSGHFAEEGFRKASYFRNIQVVDSSNQLSAPKGVGTYAQQPSCYDVQNGGDNGDWGTYFYYGGPGKNAKCP